MNIEHIRAQFPLLRRKINGKNIIYFDNAATTLKPQTVIDSIVDYYSNYCANIHRGIHLLSEESSQLYDAARSQIAKFINARHDEIIFVRNTTEAINLVSNTFSKLARKKILTTVGEHNSNFLPWFKTGNVELLSIDSKGIIEIEEMEKKIDESFALIAVNHISNVTGIINPVKEIIKTAHKMGIYVLIDAAQSISHQKIDVKNLDCDFLAFSGHKMFGPTGIGVLYVKKEILQEMEPLFVGGGMVRRVSFTDYLLEDLPFSFEAGTPNISGAIGMAEAVKFINQIGIDNIIQHDNEITSLLIEELADLKRVKLFPDYSENNAKIGIVSFQVEGIDADDIASFLSNRFNIMVRSGVHCAEILMRHFDLNSVLRVSTHIFNSREEIKLFGQSMRNILSNIAIN